MLNIFKTSIFWFSKFKYYRDLAQELNYVIPKINQELGYPQHEKCWLIGFKLVNNLSNIQHQVKSISLEPESVKVEQKQKQKQQNDSIKLQADPNARELLSYGEIFKYADKNDLDICTTNPNEKEVTLVKLRQEIYRKYYYQRIFRAKSPAKKYKQIRIPEKIQDHDLINKVENIKSLIKKGDFKFKIYCENCSDESQKKIKKFCQYLGRNQEIQIQQYEIQQTTKRRHKVMIERWNVTLDFSKQSIVDYEKVNKKWRRSIIQKKVKEQNKNKPTKSFNYDQLAGEDVQFQREVIKQLLELKAPLPHRYRDYQEMQDSVEGGEQNFFVKAVRGYSPKRNEEQIEEEEDQEDGQKNLSANPKFQRSVQQILEQMDKIKEKKGETQAFDSYKLKVLDKQLKQALVLAGYKKKN